MAALKQKKSIKFAKSNLLSVLEAEVKLSNIVGQHDILLQLNYARTKRLWVKYENNFE